MKAKSIRRGASRLLMGLPIGLFVAVTPTLAQELPRLDAVTYCRLKTSNQSAFLQQGCLTVEQSAYDYLKRVWAAMPLAIREKCFSARVAESYSMMQGCVNVETGAAQNVEKFRSKY